MNRHLTLLFLCVVLLSGCQTYEQIAIDYMIPAQITFPNEFKRVAIVNNTNLNANDSANFLPPNTTIATQTLAETIALTNYFEEVVICDSALRQHDDSYRESFLTRQEVVNLTEELDVDFIISLEDVILNLRKSSIYNPEWSAHREVADLKVYSLVNVYSDRRSEPILKYIAQDSIFWENYGATAEMAKASLISQKNMIEEGSTFAGALPVSYLIPHWKTVNRTLFNSGSVHMRDAAHLARSNEWEDAYTLWVKEYESTKSKKRKMWCANNIAVYYEMKDEITKSLEWARIAESLSIDLFDKDGQVERFGSFIDIPYIHFFKLYTAELEKREANLPALSIQMQRHNDDF